jgi:hypothetical protein
MNLDLPIPIDIYTLCNTPRIPTFGAGLTSRAFDFVTMTSATAGYRVSRALAGGPDTHAMDFFFCRLATESVGTFDVEAFISAKCLNAWRNCGRRI